MPYFKPCYCWNWVTSDVQCAKYIFSFCWGELVRRLNEFWLFSLRSQWCWSLFPVLEKGDIKFRELHDLLSSKSTALVTANSHRWREKAKTLFQESIKKTFFLERTKISCPLIVALQLIMSIMLMKIKLLILYIS